uniref:Uncharacterized protein n=1 Tax=viral metagenome TaxID=1070528 RepID=A0A6C0EAM2_9ZZZZ
MATQYDVKITVSSTDGTEVNICDEKIKEITDAITRQFAEYDITSQVVSVASDAKTMKSNSIMKSYDRIARIYTEPYTKFVPHEPLLEEWRIASIFQEKTFAKEVYTSIYFPFYIFATIDIMDRQMSPEYYDTIKSKKIDLAEFEFDYEASLIDNMKTGIIFQLKQLYNNLQKYTYSEQHTQMTSNDSDLFADIRTIHPYLLDLIIKLKEHYGGSETTYKKAKTCLVKAGRDVMKYIAMRVHRALFPEMTEEIDYMTFHSSLFLLLKMGFNEGHHTNFDPENDRQNVRLPIAIDNKLDTFLISIEKKKRDRQISIIRKYISEKCVDNAKIIYSEYMRIRNRIASYTDVKIRESLKTLHRLAYTHIEYFGCSDILCLSSDKMCADSFATCLTSRIYAKKMADRVKGEQINKYYAKMFYDEFYVIMCINPNIITYIDAIYDEIYLLASFCP